MIEQLCRRFADTCRARGWRWEMIQREDFCVEEPSRIAHCVPIDYLERIRLIDNRYFGLYLHCFWSDDEDGLHDHPFPFLSVILAGRYHEERIGRKAWYFAGDVLYRGSECFHRITGAQPGRTWTLFFRGPRLKQWGFLARGVEEAWYFPRQSVTRPAKVRA